MATRLDSAGAEFLANQAAMQERAGRIGEALASITEAFGAQPKRGDWAHRAGLLLLRCGRYREAVAMQRRAVALLPKSAMIQHDLGLALFRDGQFDQAAACFERSHALEPHLPVHLVHLAITRERLRDTTGAKAAAFKALELDPSHGPAMIVIGESLLREGKAREAIEMGERGLGLPLPPLIIARGHHLVARAWEKLGEWDKAFEAHMRCNQVVYERGDGAAALAVDIEVRMRNMRREGLAERFARWAAEAPTNTPDPVFLCGFPRSGTTLIEQVMSVFRGLATNDEQANAGIVLEDMERKRPGTLAEDLADVLDALPPDRVRAYRTMFWEEIIRRMPDYKASGKVTAIDKQPLRLMDIGVVQRVFPRARMLVMIRDPRDVCLSALFQNFDPNPAMARFLTVETTGRFYAEVMSFWLEMRPKITMPYMEVRYEDLVKNFESETKRIASFLGVEWTEAVNRFDEAAKARAVTSASYNAVTERINERSLGRWRAYRSHLGPVLEAVRPIVEAYGYEPD